jgi:hypothetical protein
MDSGFLFSVLTVVESDACTSSVYVYMPGQRSGVSDLPFIIFHRNKEKHFLDLIGDEEVEVVWFFVRLYIVLYCTWNKIKYEQRTRLQVVQLLTTTTVP